MFLNIHIDLGRLGQRQIRVDGMAAFASLPEEVPAVAEAVRSAPDRLVGVALVNPRAEGAATPPTITSQPVYVEEQLAPAREPSIPTPEPNIQSSAAASP